MQKLAFLKKSPRSRISVSRTSSRSAKGVMPPILVILLWPLVISDSRPHLKHTYQQKNHPEPLNLDQSWSVGSPDLTQALIQRGDNSDWMIEGEIGVFKNKRVCLCGCQPLGKTDPQVTSVVLIVPTTPKRSNGSTRTRRPHQTLSICNTLQTTRERIANAMANSLS